MIYFVLGVIVLFLALIAIDILRNCHPLTQDEADCLASKRQRLRQLLEYKFSTEPRPANPKEKKAMESAGEFVECNLDYYEAPSRIAGLLKYKKHEWIVIAFISRKRVLRLWWNKGPDGTRVWSFLRVDSIQALVRTLGLDALAILHNHPNPDPSRYRMNRPSETDLKSAEYLHRIFVPLGGSLLEFICERGIPHVYYAAFAYGVAPIQPILAEIASANDKGILHNYWLRKELARTTTAEEIPGRALLPAGKEIRVKRRYLDLMGNSGVTEIDDSVAGVITVWFGSQGYEYTDANSGAHHVREMRARAAANTGLCQYINQNMSELHPKKLG
jgi:hypothetical protein